MKTSTAKYNDTVIENATVRPEPTKTFKAPFSDDLLGLLGAASLATNGPSWAIKELHGSTVSTFGQMLYVIKNLNKEALNRLN